MMTDAVTAPNYLEMSDEELMKLPMPTASATPVEEVPVVTPEPEAQPVVVTPPVEVVATPVPVDTPVDPPVDPLASPDTPAPAATPVATPDTAPASATPATPVASDGKGAAAAPSAASGAAEATAAGAAVPEKKEDAPAAKPDAPAVASPAAPAFDYEAAYKKLTAPFKANGRDFQVENVEDAISLMQMGVNYNKKMAALKPNLKLLKTLENHGLLSEEKIGFLIDLSKKDPAAINKLVADSGINPLDISADKASEYKQSTYTVDEREVELDTVLDELQGSPGYAQTLEVVSTKWDRASKQVIAQEPAILKVINGHVESGIYEIIAKKVESERLFGRLKGLSDIDAYKQVGDALNAAGAFNHLAQGSSPAQAATAPAAQSAAVTPAQPAAAAVVPVVPQAAAKPKVDEDTLKAQRRAASSTPVAAATPGKPADFNPLAMSDDEFAKTVNSKFL
jgi:hypothetical protein